MIGLRYGRLQVVAISSRVLARSDGGTEPYVTCRCSCGIVKDFLAGNVRRGNTTSCGCHRTEVLKEIKTSHGRALRPGTREKTKVYKAWLEMRRRCSDRSNLDYGGRGISVCKEWEESFTAFFRDVGEPPSVAHSLDRYPDVHGDYEPGNVRWATAAQQANNRRPRRMPVYML